MKLINTNTTPPVPAQLDSVTIELTGAEAIMLLTLVGRLGGGYNGAALTVNREASGYYTLQRAYVPRYTGKEMREKLASPLYATLDAACAEFLGPHI